MTSHPHSHLHAAHMHAAHLHAQSSQYCSSEVFTPEMRDRQARGKDPYGKAEGSEESEGSDDPHVRPGRKPAVETFAERERKGEALSVLDNPETLMAHAQANDDSISGQRLRFMRQLCGLEGKPNVGRKGKGRRISDRGGR
ncbi:hypothetical protein AK830_g11454 [Neonectria ditissima]|uniref:Uncharacterized protein n=1 Tax=Neonectria ditissima TaxID=78410 RepID=A0A0P7B514_9HYPO|nr:hypothetical protein AK830_g11454 [Neonectria ditissima]